jgi:hypothetical protein
MPQVGWLYKGRKYTKEEMEAYADSYPEGFPFTPGQVREMWNGPERDYISPTTLGSCARAWHLKRTTDYWEDIEKSWAKFRGTAIHKLMEGEYNEPDAILEQRRQKTITTAIGPVVIEGTPDKVVPSKGLLIDYKSMNDDKIGKLKPAWVQQLSCYRWMLFPDIPIERAFIQQIAMKNTFRLEIKLWDLEKTESWIRARAPEFARVLSGGVTEDNLPRVLIDGLDSGTYLCWGWCPVGPECRRLAAQGK